MAEVSHSFENELSRQASVRGVKFFDVKVTGEAMMNAILLHFLDLPSGERDEILDRYLASFAGMLALPDEGSNPGRVIVPESTPEPAANVPRKRKGAG